MKHPCAESVLIAVAFPGVNVVKAENACDMLSWVGGMVNVFPQSLDAVSFGVPSEDNDRGGFSNTQSLWIQMVGPALCQSRLALIGSRFHCITGILLRLRRSFKVSIGFFEASCPSRWAYPYFRVLLYSLLTTGLGFDVRCLPLVSCLAQTYCTSSIARSARSTVSLKGLGDVNRWLSRSHFHVSNQRSRHAFA